MTFADEVTVAKGRLETINAKILARSNTITSSSSRFLGGSGTRGTDAKLFYDEVFNNIASSTTFVTVSNSSMLAHKVLLAGTLGYTDKTPEKSDLAAANAALAAATAGTPAATAAQSAVTAATNAGLAGKLPKLNYNDVQLFENSSSKALAAGVIDVNNAILLDKTDPTSLKMLRILQKLYLIHDLFYTTNWYKLRNGWPDTQDVYLQTFVLNLNNACSGGVTLISDYEHGKLIKKVKLINRTVQSGEIDILATSPAPNFCVATASSVIVARIQDLEDVGGETIPLRDIIADKSLTTFPFRRLFYLWIQMANYRIARLAKDDSSPPANISSPFKEITYKLIARANDNVGYDQPFMSGSTVGGVRKDGLMDSIQQKQLILRETGSAMGDLNTKLAENQKSVATTKSTVDAESSNEKKVRIFEIVTFSLLVAVFVATAAITGIPGIDESKKTIFSIAVLAVAVVSAVIILLVYQNKYAMEGFYTQGGVKYDTTTITNVDEGFMNQVSVFLVNTITLMSNLESYDMSRNMNRVVVNEYTRYAGINNELLVADKKLDGIAKYSALSRAEKQSRVYLFITLTLILAFVLPVYVWAKDYPSIRTTAMGVAIVLAIIAITFHTYDTTSIVRTDGNKKYWGQPDGY